MDIKTQKPRALVMLTPDEHMRLRVQAEAAGTTITAYTRQMVLAALEEAEARNVWLHEAYALARRKIDLELE